MRIGLALGSGGSRAIAHIGIIKTLLKAGIRPTIVAGTSMGAMIAALYARDGDIERVEKTMTKAPTWTSIAKLVFMSELSLKGGMLQQGERLKNFVEREFGTMRFYNLAVDCATVATHFKTGEKGVFTTGLVSKAVLASMAFPFVFPPVSIRGELYFDGGMVEAVPATTLKAMECDIVIAINLDNEEMVRFSGQTHNPFHVLQQGININRYHLAQFNCRHASIVVKPHTGEKGLIGWNGFMHGDAMVKIGERAMKKELPLLQEKIARLEAKYHII